MDIGKAYDYKNIFRAREVAHNETVTKTRGQSQAQQIYLAFGKQKCHRICKMLEIPEVWDLFDILIMQGLLDEKTTGESKEYALFTSDLMKTIKEIKALLLKEKRV
jgi:hypothetical protein